MKYIFGIVCLVASSIVCSSGVEESVELGNELTQAVKSKAYVKLKSFDNYKEIKNFLKKNQCPGFKYRAYSLTEKDRFYLVASKGKGVVIGRHYVGRLNGNSVDISTLSSSTNSCINLGSPKKDAAAMFVTHLKSEPNEFHVLQSNLANIALYVSAKGTLYSVFESSISEVEK